MCLITNEDDAYKNKLFFGRKTPVTTNLLCSTITTINHVIFSKTVVILMVIRLTKIWLNSKTMVNVSKENCKHFTFGHPCMFKYAGFLDFNSEKLNENLKF